MSSYIDIQGKKYLYEINYKDNEILRNSFNGLAEKTFGINFEKWYKEGYWSDSYIPYSLVYNNKVVSNVSVSIMDIMIQGDEKRYIQIGTVMTDEEYRNNGLSRFLMEKIIEEWEDKCDFIYLYANDSVLKFYPRFGFEKYNEYQYSINSVKEKSKEKIRKLNIDNTSDKDILTEVINNKIPLSNLHIKNNSSLIMFYCLDFMKENIYYIEDFNTVTICEYDKEVLYVQDIFLTQEIDLDKIINMLMKEETKKVVLGFTPNNTACYEENLVNEEDTTLFIRAKKENPFKIEKLMFPVLSHA